MARDIHSRLLLRGELVAHAPLHVGGYGEEVDTDLPLARDGAGQLYVPGTSLAGALRELAERMFDERDALLRSLWGDVQDDQGQASRVLVDDAVLADADSLPVEIRDHVGIDRELGSAAEHIKFDRAILPRGTRLGLQLTLEVPSKLSSDAQSEVPSEDPSKAPAQDARSKALAMLAALKRALQQGELRLGAAKTRGLGLVVLENGQVTEQVFASREGILAAVQGSLGSPVPEDELHAALRAFPLQPRPRLTLTVHWRPAGPLMVKAGGEGIASDMLPLTSAVPRDGRGNGPPAFGVCLVLPGSAIKGALRAHAERIVRTVRGDLSPDWLNREGKKKFLEAVEVPLINELFGQRGEKVKRDDPRTWLPGQGALAVRDCYGTQRLSSDQWKAIQSAEDDRQLRLALQQAGLQAWSQAYHVAIDRWLGSAAEGMLYSVLEPHGTAWEPIALEVDLYRLPVEPNLDLEVLALLLLVLRDLAAGRLPLGFATHRGLGAVQVEQIEIRGVDLPEYLRGLEHVLLAGGRLADLPPRLRQDLNQAWQQWLAQHQEQTAR